MKKLGRVLVLLFNNFSSDSRVLKECTTLVENGYAVELWAYFDPKLPKEETINGFTVRRKLLVSGKAGRLPNWVQNWIKRIKNQRNRFFRYPVKILKPFPPLYRIAKTTVNTIEETVVLFLRTILSKYRLRKTVTKINKNEKFDFDMVHCNDLLPLEVGMNIKKKHPSLKIVYDSHEYQTETPKLNASPPAKQYMQNLERTCIAYADEVITVSEPIANEYQKMYNLKSVHVIKNCPPKLAKRPNRSTYFRSHFNLPLEGLIFLYQGALKQSRGVGEILDGFSMLWKKGFTSHHIVFMGYGPYENEIRNQTQAFPNIHFHPSVSMYELPEISNSADYGIIYTPDTCKNHSYSLPNKLFEYIAFGLPVIVSPLETMKQLVEREQIGFVTKGFSPTDLCEKISQITNPAEDQMRDLLWKLHVEKYNWNIEERIFLKIYNNL